MSDGPHRSPNMRKHWKKPTERAVNPAHSLNEVCEAMEYAMKKDILEAPIARVREILGSDTLFPNLRIEQLENLRINHPGSFATNSLIDCAIEAAASGQAGDSGTESALQAALEDNIRANLRSIDEICQREASARTSRTVRDRLENASAQIDCGSIAREILAPARPPSKRSVKLSRKAGIDEGPPL